MHKHQDLDPFLKFREWQQNADVKDCAAAALATATKSGLPSVRMVLVKSFSCDGFVFYTNLGSKKAKNIAENNNAALLFNWSAQQVRIEGKVYKVDQKTAEEYFLSRPEQSRIISILSRQSQVLEDEETFLQSIKNYQQTNAKKQFTKPDYWHGFCIKPKSIEFWQEGQYRCHKRLLYKLQESGKWEIFKLYP